jgi:hypothetical protein
MRPQGLALLKLNEIRTGLDRSTASLGRSRSVSREASASRITRPERSAKGSRPSRRWARCCSIVRPRMLRRRFRQPRSAYRRRAGPRCFRFGDRQSIAWRWSSMFSRLGGRTRYRGKKPTPGLLSRRHITGTSTLGFALPTVMRDHGTRRADLRLSDRVARHAGSCCGACRRAHRCLGGRRGQRRAPR